MKLGYKKKSRKGSTEVVGAGLPLLETGAACNSICFAR